MFDQILDAANRRALLVDWVGEGGKLSEAKRVVSFFRRGSVCNGGLLELGTAWSSGFLR
jgi:hypothetical protein